MPLGMATSFTMERTCKCSQAEESTRYSNTLHFERVSASRKQIL